MFSLYILLNTHSKMCKKVEIFFYNYFIYLRIFRFVQQMHVKGQSEIQIDVTVLRDLGRDWKCLLSDTIGTEGSYSKHWLRSI